MIGSSRHEFSGISPVIGIVLFVAIVVVLAGVVGFFVTGVNDDTSGTSQAGLNTSQSQEEYQVQVVDSGNVEKLSVKINGKDIRTIDVTSGSIVDVSELSQVCDGDTVTLIGSSGDSSTTLNTENITEDINCNVEDTTTSSTATYNGSSWIVDTYLQNNSDRQKKYVITLSNGTDQQVTETVTLQPGESTTIQSKESSYSKDDPISVGIYSPSSGNTADYSISGGSLSDSSTSSTSPTSSSSLTGGSQAQTYSYEPTKTDGTTDSSTSSDSSSSISTSSGGEPELSLSSSRIKSGDSVAAYATLTTSKDPSAEETLVLYATETNSSSNIVSKSTHTIEQSEEKTVSVVFSITDPNEYVITASLEGSSEMYRVGTLTVVDSYKFSVSNVSMTPENPDTGEEITFTADVTNNGSSSQTVTAKLFDNGDAFKTQEVSINSNSTKTLSANYTPDGEQIHKFHIGIVEPAIVEKISEVYIGDNSSVSISTSSPDDAVNPDTEFTLNATASHSDSTVSIEKYEWNINTNTTTTTSGSLSTSISSEGVYDYTVTAIASNGDSKTAGGSVIVSDLTAPSATINASTSVTTPGSSISFSGSSDSSSTNLSYDWDLDDGTTKTKQDISHSYSSKGTYTVSLTVTNTDTGLSSTTTKDITVDEEVKLVIVTDSSDFEPYKVFADKILRGDDVNSYEVGETSMTGGNGFASDDLTVIGPEKLVFTEGVGMRLKDSSKCTTPSCEIVYKPESEVKSTSK